MEKMKLVSQVKSIKHLYKAISYYKDIKYNILQKSIFSETSNYKF